MRKWHVIVGGVAIVALALLVGWQLLGSRTGWPRQPELAPVPDAPKLVLEKTTHDFGVIDPTEPRRHLFIVRNVGTAPLKVAKAGTTCKCTISMLPKGEIPPGMGGPIEIDGKDDNSFGKFRHTAGFVSNDPQTPRFDLTIEGEIRTYLAASNPAVHWSDLPRGMSTEASTIIFSQVWKGFALKEVRSSIEGLTWDLQPAPPERLQECEARSGYVATLRMPGKAVSTSFQGWLEAVAESPEQPENRKTIRVSVSGHVPALRTVYGPAVDADGVVMIGSVRPGESATVNLVLRIHGQHRGIRVERIDKAPDFLHVSVEPMTPEPAKNGLYRIVLEVPREAPSCNYMIPGSMGDVRILTDHPEMPEIVRLKVAFAVASG